MIVTRSKYAESGKSPRWSDDEMTVLVALHVRGFSASEIAKRMHRTRNEVLGKLWRMRKAVAA